MRKKRNVFRASDGAEISFVDIGEGQPFIWIHGWAGNSSRLEMLLEGLSEYGIRCICFDQRGCGFTASTENIGVPQSAKDTKELIEYLGLEDVILMGYSMGAAVLLSYVEAFGTQHLKKLIIGDMSPKPLNEDDWHYGLYQGWYKRENIQNDLYNMEHDYKKFAIYFADQVIFTHSPDEERTFVVDDDFIKRVYERAAKENKTDLLNHFLIVDTEHERANRLYWKSCDYHDYRDAVGKIDKPCAFFYAVPGSIYQKECAEWMASKVAAASLYEFEGCTHMASSEKPIEFQKAIIDFIRKR